LIKEYSRQNRSELKDSAQEEHTKFRN
jgi:hypothetical protein